MPCQVHGARIVEAGPSSEAARADGVISRDAAWAPTVRTADCVPLLLVAPAADVAAAVHAGWRGVASRIVPEAVRALAARGADRSRIYAAIGPSIGACCYAVSRTVAEVLRGAVDGRGLRGGGPDGSVDLRLAVERHLLRAGLRESRIWRSDACTRCDGDRWYSHRREGGVAGRQAAVVGRPLND